ncbi:MAG: MobF family relaxase, partial [Acidimicrobiales bacterium]
VSAPKGVSLLAALDPTVRPVIETAHLESASVALSYLEEHLWARRGRDGHRREAVDGLVAAAFTHRTSRAGDPQLHTHVLAANLVRGDDGMWSAPDARPLYRHLATAGHLYHAELRATLTEQLGVGWGPVRKGMAEPAGFTAAQLAEFSRRRIAIEAVINDTAYTSGRAREIAALDTRTPKPLTTGEELLADWRARAANVGITQDTLRNMIGHDRTRSLPDTDALAAVLLGPAGLTAHHTATDRRFVLRAIAEHAQGGAHRAELDTLADCIMADPRAVILNRPDVARPTGDDEHRLTTTELVRLEARLVAEAETRRVARTAIVDRRTLEHTLAEHPGLSAEQLTMVRRLTTSGAGVDVVVGGAGSGKTTGLAAARDAWDADGIATVGVALAARAANQLQADAGIRSTTIARFLNDRAQGGDQSRMPAGSVLVVDEAAMVDTRTIACLATIAADDNLKLVLVGDHRQLPEIGAGGIFAALTQRLDPVVLVENRRQTQAWERQALRELRAGDINAAVAAWADHNRIHLHPDPDTALRAVVDDWAVARANGQQAVMYAQTRQQVQLLNGLARERQQLAGRLIGPDITFGDRSFAIGDDVVALRNHYTLGLTNGAVGRVVSVDQTAGERGLAIRFDHRDGERDVRVPAWYAEAGRLDHAYALTFHKAQGASVDRAFVYGTDALYREAAYTALSRARGRVDLHLPESEIADLNMSEPGLHQVAVNLHTSRAHTLALDQSTAATSEPPVVIGTLGPRPLAGADRDLWDDLARDALAYRQRHGVDDPVLLLGPSTGDIQRLIERRQLAERVTAAQRHLGIDRDELHRGIGQ